MSSCEIAAEQQRPDGGWIRAIRQSRGLSLQAVADRLKVSPQAVHQFEKSEAAGTISLRQLGNVVAAMDCRLSYSVLLPKGPTVTRPKSKSALEPAASPRGAAASSPPEPIERAIEQSMFLQNQADGRFD